MTTARSTASLRAAQSALFPCNSLTGVAKSSTTWKLRTLARSRESSNNSRAHHCQRGNVIDHIVSDAMAQLNQEPKLLISLDAAFPHAKAPTRGSAFAAGYDLYAAEDVTLKAHGGRGVVATGIRLAVPAGCYGRVAPRSGLASKHGIDVGAGVIDADYRGLLGVLLFNLGTSDFEIKAGDRVAQLVLERIATPDVEVVASLDETIRGAGGFGSTGGFGAPTV